MSLAVMCQWLEPRKKRDGSIVYENIIDEKSLQLGAYKAGKYSEERIRDTYRHNVQQHIDLIPKLIENNIKSFRISSSLFPLFEFAGEIAKRDSVLLGSLDTLGRAFMQNGIRVTTHPGQFTVISSDRDVVVQNSIRELEYHAWVFDKMGLSQTPYNAINIHGGKANRSERILEALQSLPSNVKSRLTFENDEKCYNVKKLLQIHEKSGVPVVFDCHHFTFGSDDYDFDTAYKSTMATWGNIKPLQHLSNTEPGKENASFNEKRSHSNYIHSVPPLQLASILDNTVDVDVEAKMKNLAVIKMRNDFNIGE